MTSPRSFRTFARRSARTLPAKPAPTIKQSYMIRLLRRRDGEDGEGGRRTLGGGAVAPQRPDVGLVHGAPGLTPGTGGQMPVPLREPSLLGPLQEDFRLANHFERRLGD